MSYSYIGNEQEWKRLIAVDWLGQYVKAWIAFNAWYRNYFSPSFDRDREVIDEIKNDQGNICSRIAGRLVGGDLISKSFQSNVADLHSSLFHVIKSNNKRISFESIEDYECAQYVNEESNRITYEIEIQEKQKRRIVRVKNSKDQKIFNKIIKRNEEGNISDSWYNSLSPAQKDNLKGFLTASTPIHNLLTSDSDCINIGSFRFINDQNLIARAIIEILYQLRNALFHGEITPDSGTQQIYKPAYLILEAIIDSIG